MIAGITLDQQSDFYIFRDVLYVRFLAVGNSFIMLHVSFDKFALAEAIIFQ